MLTQYNYIVHINFLGLVAFHMVIQGPGSFCLLDPPSSRILETLGFNQYRMMRLEEVTSTLFIFYC